MLVEVLHVLCLKINEHLRNHEVNNILVCVSYNIFCLCWYPQLPVNKPVGNRGSYWWDNEEQEENPSKLSVVTDFQKSH